MHYLRQGIYHTMLFSLVRYALLKSERHQFSPCLIVYDITQITLRSDLLSQIRGSIVVLRDQIHMELEHTIDLSSYVVKLGK